MAPHLVDGFLGRSFMFLGFCLHFLPAVRARLTDVRNPLAGGKALLAWSGALVAAGALISLNAVVASASDPGFADGLPGRSEWRSELAGVIDWALPVLTGTQYGGTWSATLALWFCLCGIRVREIVSGKLVGPVFQMAMAVLLAAGFTRMGHGGTFGIWSLWYLIQVAHVGGVGYWLSALGCFAIQLYPVREKERLDIPRFSRGMNRVMPMILLTGAARSGAIWPEMPSFAREPYLWVFAGKLILAALLLVIAARLRSRFRRLGLSEKERLVTLFSGEIALAATLVFSSALLSQLSPP